jgi:hypothetical protein
MYWRSFNKPISSAHSHKNLNDSDRSIAGVRLIRQSENHFRNYWQLKKIRNLPPILSADWGNSVPIDVKGLTGKSGDGNAPTIVSNHPGLIMSPNDKSMKDIPLLQSRGPQVNSLDPFHAPFSWEPTFVTSDTELYSIFTAADLGIHPYNNPPNQAEDPNPADGATGIDPIDLILMWTGSDPDEDQLHYDIYFGTQPQPPLVVSNHPDDWWEIPYDLEDNTVYYWRIDSKDYEFTTTGDVWSFETAGAPPTPTAPPQPTSTPTPGPRSISIYTNQELYHPHDYFHLWTIIRNPAPRLEVDEFILLDVWGEYWFWPSWRQEPMDYLTRWLEPWTTYEETILEFEWPEGTGEAHGIVFWAAIFHTGTFDFAGDFGMCTFGWEE